MPRVFDVVLASNDMSLERVLGAGLPVALVFYHKDLQTDLRQALEQLARQYAGKALLVTLSQSDAPHAISRFSVQQLPALVTSRDGKVVTRQESVRAADLIPHISYLIGEGPVPQTRLTTHPSTAAGQAAIHEPVPVSERDFEREVLHSDKPVLVDFWAPWCAPCKMVEPILKTLAREQGNTLKVAKVNVDENPTLASRYGAMSIPTMIVMVGGREVDRWIGAMPESALRNRVARWIQS